MENQIIKNAGFHHLALMCSDLERSLHFYLDGLGCRLVRQWGEGLGHIVMIDFGGGNLLELFAKGTSQPEANARFAHIAIATSDPDGAYAAALKAGAVSMTEPKDVVLDDLPARIAFVTGPDGEILEFFCEKA